MNMDAFKGNYTRISEEKYEEMLQVIFLVNSWCLLIKKC